MKFKFLTLGISFALAACGGGGGDSKTPIGPAEGAYEGTTNFGGNFQTLILENGEIWILYGVLSQGTFFIDGFIQGSGTSNNGAYSTSNARDFFDGEWEDVNINATYRPGVRIDGTLSNSFASGTFSGVSVPSSAYNYNRPALVSEISGNWSLNDVENIVTTMVITSNGNVSGSSQGCAFTGKMTPRPSGKNVFNFSVSFGGAPCSLPGQTASGIAITNLINGGPTRQLLIMGTDQSRTSGTVLFGAR